MTAHNGGSGDTTRATSLTHNSSSSNGKHYRVDAASVGVLLTAQVERLYSSSAEAGFRAAAPVGVGVTQLQVRQQEMVVGSARRRSHQTLCAKLPQLAKQPVARARSLSPCVSALVSAKNCYRHMILRRLSPPWGRAAGRHRWAGPGRGGAAGLGRLDRTACLTGVSLLLPVVVVG